METWVVVVVFVLGAIVWDGVGRSLSGKPPGRGLRAWAERASLSAWMAEAKKAYLRHDDIALWNMQASVRYSNQLDDEQQRIVITKLSKYIDDLYTDVKEEF